MTQENQPAGWRLHHHEQLSFKASAGAPTIRLKFFHYPAYRQTVIINHPPAHCKLKKKKNNSFFLYQQKVPSKGRISLERIISVYPHPSSVSLTTSWGEISDIPRLLQRKYKQNSTYWPVDSEAIKHVSDERWFSTNNLSEWVLATSRYIITTIKHPENQDKRLGADHVVRTGSGDCDEFTDLFITLARRRGIPCRRLTGYYIHEKNLPPEPHAWGEIQSPTIGWIPIDIALHNIGHHTFNYVIVKIEEFIPSLLDYQIQKQSSAVHYHWERPLPLITPLYALPTKEEADKSFK